MARIRTIKPEFWTSAQVLECSTNVRLLFVGLWNFSDDAGRHPDSPKQCKAEVFPADDFTLADVRGMIDELSENGLIVRYVHGGKGYFYIPGWHHQRIDKPQKPKYPDPFDEHSENVLGTFPPDTIGYDTKGYDTKGKDPNTGGKPPTSEPDEFLELRKIYPKRSGDQRWKAALGHCKARLKEGHTWTEVLDGARRYAAWCAATDKIGTETVKQAATFVGTEKAFLEPWTLPKRQLSAIERVLNPEKADDRLVN